MFLPPYRSGRALLRWAALSLVFLHLIPHNAIATNEDATGGQTRLTIYFGNDRLKKNPTDCSEVFPVERSVPSTRGVAAAALRGLLSGPSPSEREAGYYSMFSTATAGLLKDVRVRGNTAYVDLADFREALPGASSSCGSAEFQAQLSRTLFQFPKVKRVIYAINGSPRTFYAWLGAPCDRTNGYCDPRPFRPRPKPVRSP